MCNERALPVGQNEHGTVRHIPECPEDPDIPSRDRWMERHPGLITCRDDYHGPSVHKMVKSFRNGRYQHFMFLGICGFVICNHCDKEILLVDPWPTHFSYWSRVNALQPIVDRHPEPSRRELTEDSLRATEARERIADLATFLRFAVQQEYKLSGILVSHLHFDHAEDIISLLELIAAEEGYSSEGHPLRDKLHDYRYRDHNGLEYYFSGPPVPMDKLPKICCDYDSMIYFLTYNFYVPYSDIDIHGNDEINIPTGSGAHRGPRYWVGNTDLKARLDWLHRRRQRRHREENETETWRAIKNHYAAAHLIPGSAGVVDNDRWYEINVGGRRLHYDDSYNNSLENEADRCKAGQQCNFFALDNFMITPYIWDHMNTGMWKTRRPCQDEQGAGFLQRMSAFMISHRSPNVVGAKRTFIIGSMGAMSQRYTQALAGSLPSIQTDLLIIAVTTLHPLTGMWYHRERDDFLHFLTEFIDVRDAVMLTHFEEFVREISSTNKYRAGFWEAILNGDLNLDDSDEEYRPPFIEDLLQVARRNGRTCFQTLFDRNRYYTLVRHGFEITIPTDPITFKRQENEYYRF